MSVTAQDQCRVDDQTSAWRGLIRIASILEVFATWRAAWVTSQEAKDEDAEEKEDDRVNGNLEGEHGDRPASDTAIILWGMTGSQPGSTPCRYDDRSGLKRFAVVHIGICAVNGAVQVRRKRGHLLRSHGVKTIVLTGFLGVC